MRWKFRSRWRTIGGAVAAQGPITVTSSTLQTNTAGLRGGAIFAIGTLDTTADFTGYVIAASDFTSNTVLDGDGGAIYAEGPLTISSSQFAGNAAIGNSSPQEGRSTTAAASWVAG